MGEHTGTQKLSTHTTQDFFSSEHTATPMLPSLDDDFNPRASNHSLSGLFDDEDADVESLKFSRPLPPGTKPKKSKATASAPSRRPQSNNHG